MAVQLDSVYLTDFRQHFTTVVKARSEVAKYHPNLNIHVLCFLCLRASIGLTTSLKRKLHLDGQSSHLIFSRALYTSQIPSPEIRKIIKPQKDDISAYPYWIVLYTQAYGSVPRGSSLCGLELGPV